MPETMKKADAFASALLAVKREKQASPLTIKFQERLSVPAEPDPEDRTKNLAGFLDDENTGQRDDQTNKNHDDVHACLPFSVWLPGCDAFMRV